VEEARDESRLELGEIIIEILKFFFFFFLFFFSFSFFDRAALSAFF